jgi:acid phosphatase (class A)
MLLKNACRAAGRRTILAALLASAIATAPAGARDTTFVQPEQFDATEVLHSPPANDSPTTKAELAELHRIQDARTPEALRKARADAANQTVFLFSTVFGDGFTAGKLPVTAALFDRIASDESVLGDVPKYYWKRSRPKTLDDTIQTCAPTGSFSYPSGHATRGYLFGVVLAAAVPEKHDAILDRAADYAHSRVVCGAHFPSDVEAGRVLGTSLAAVMLAQPGFRQDLDAVRRELKAAGYTVGN